MTRSLALIDPRAVALALVTVAASVLLGVQLPHAVAGGIAVLAFGTVLERVTRRSAVTESPVPVAAAAPRPEIEPRTTAADAPYGRLTARELEVAVFIAQGHTNREIADRLVLSERTIDNHLQHVMDKLGVHRRSQVSAWIAERGLLPKDRP